MRIAAKAMTTAALVVAATTASSHGRLAQPAEAAAATPCVAAVAGQPRLLIDKVPPPADAHLTAAGDGGVLMAFSSFRGSQQFPASHFTVLALDASGCSRWRVSLTGTFPLSSPIATPAGTVVVASATRTRDGGIGPLRVYTLSAATGRVRRQDLFGDLGATTGIAPTLVGDRRGNVALVLATNLPPRKGSRQLRQALVKLTLRAHERRWSRQVLARANTRPPVVASLPDGTLVVGYPAHGRLRVRIGSIDRPLGPDVDASPLGGYFEGGAIAIGRDGTVAATWQTRTDLRAAVRPAGRRRFTPFTQLASNRAPARLFADPPDIEVGTDGRAVVRYSTEDPVSGARQVTCAAASAAGEFGRPRQLPDAAVPGGSPSELILGPADATTIVTSTAIVTLDADCQARSTEPLDPAVDPPIGAVVDRRRRLWLLGQQGGEIDVPAPLQLTITRPLS